VEQKLKLAVCNLCTAIVDLSGRDECYGVFWADGIQLVFAGVAMVLEEVLKTVGEAIKVGEDTVSQRLIPIRSLFGIWIDGKRIDIKSPWNT